MERVLFENMFEALIESSSLRLNACMQLYCTLRTINIWEFVSSSPFYIPDQ